MDTGKEFLSSIAKDDDHTFDDENLTVCRKHFSTPKLLKEKGAIPEADYVVTNVSLS